MEGKDLVKLIPTHPGATSVHEWVYTVVTLAIVIWITLILRAIISGKLKLNKGFMQNMFGYKKFFLDAIYDVHKEYKEERIAASKAHTEVYSTMNKDNNKMYAELRKEQVAINHKMIEMKEDHISELISQASRHQESLDKRDLIYKDMFEKFHDENRGVNDKYNDLMEVYKLAELDMLKVEQESKRIEQENKELKEQLKKRKSR